MSAAAQQSSGTARCGDGGWGGDGGLRRQFGAGRSGLNTDQHIQRVHRHVQLIVQCGDRAAHLRQRAFGLPQLQFRRDALAILQGDQINEALLRIKLGAGHIEPRLKHADRDISVGDLRRDRQAHRHRARFAGLPIGPRGIARGIASPNRSISQLAPRSTS
jgi:hypothetical protein